jgi:hypothetical protein
MHPYRSWTTRAIREFRFEQFLTEAGAALTTMEDIEGFAGVPIGLGTLYGAITRLEERGCIRPVESDGNRRPQPISEVRAPAPKACMKRPPF